MNTRYAALFSVAVVLLVAPCTSLVHAADLDTWTAPANVASIIAPCAKPVGDDPPSKATPCSQKFVDACSHANGDSTLAISQCAEAAATYWSDVVVQRTSALVKLHQPTVTTYVRESGAAWKRYLTTRCAKYTQFEGSLYEIVAAECHLDTSIQRADDLGVYADHVTAKGVQ